MMRVLLVTPFSPFAEHDHAASDTIVPLARELAKRHELHVFTTDARGRGAAEEAGVHLWTSEARRPSRVRAAIGVRPYWLRQDWPRGATREVTALGRRICADVVHCEYLQTAEVIHAVGLPSVLTLHDVSGNVMRRALNAAVGIRKPYRFAEWLRTDAFEARSVAVATVPVTLSHNDAAYLGAANPELRVIPPGVTIPQREWTGTDVRTGVIVFVGAMWRRANQVSALRLVRSIMPLVWEQVPEALVRIVGAGPTQAIIDLQRDGRITVTGHVDSVDDELRKAAVVACPTVFGGGVLMKLLHSLAIGAPAVADRESASSLGLSEDVLWVADSDGDFADALTAAIRNQAAAAAKAERGRRLAAERFAWTKAAVAFSSAYERALELSA